MDRISLEDWEEWRLHPVTQAVKAALKIRRQELLEAPLLDLNSVDRTALRSAHVTGQIDGVDEFLEFRPEDQDEAEQTRR